MKLDDQFLIDVRSPGEYSHGHIPGAHHLPLFSDEERKIVGITYKTQGKRLAIEKGLQLVQFSRIIEEIKHLNPPQSFTVYCARGGMRSSSMAWLLNLLGYNAQTMKGGYKSFRKWALAQFSIPYSLVVLGGETGSRKTKIIHQLSNISEKTIDLESLAHHRGSVFGGMDNQPTQEQFENDLSIILHQQKDHRMWIENESERIGSVTIPHAFYQQMKEAPTIALQVPKEVRINECLNEYLNLGSKQLNIAIHRLQKRLGGLQTKKALAALEENNFRECCEILLQYYDKKYRYGMSLRKQEQVKIVPITTESIDQIALLLKSFV